MLSSVRSRKGSSPVTTWVMCTWRNSPQPGQRPSSNVTCETGLKTSVIVRQT